MSRLSHKQQAVDSHDECAACGGTDFKLLISRQASRHLQINTVYRITQCQQCGLAFVQDPPGADELSAVYDRHFFSTSQQTAPVDADGGWTPGARHSPIYLNACRRVRDLRGFKDAGNLLDIGCGKGYFLKVASQHFTVMGNDLSAHAATYGREILGLNVTSGDFTQVSMPENHFDVVTMWDVLASLGDPTAAIDRVSRLLRPSGLFVFTIPDIQSLTFRLTGRFWPLLIPPINLFYYTRRSVQSLLDRFGLQLVCYRHDGKHIGTNFVLRKLGRIFGISFLDHENAKIPGLRKLYLNLWDIATVYAQKG